MESLFPPNLLSLLNTIVCLKVHSLGKVAMYAMIMCHQLSVDS